MNWLAVALDLNLLNALLVEISFQSVVSLALDFPKRIPLLRWFALVSLYSRNTYDPR
jgi:hypothetical protein